MNQNPNPPPRTKEWLAVYHACLREFPESELGKEAYHVAERAADKIVAEQKAEDEAAKRPK